MSHSAKRAAAAQACINRFAGHGYQPGSRDDIRMAAHLLHHLGIAVPILKGCRWTSEAQGIRLLKRRGFATVHEAVDTLGLPRIPWAHARVGDLIALPSLCEAGALAVHTGNGTMLAYPDGANGAAVLRIRTALHAWRTI